MFTFSTSSRRAQMLSTTALGSGVILSLVTFVLIEGTNPAVAQSVLPQGGTVASGVTAIGAPQANTLTINQSSARAVINWNSFSVGQPNTVTFNQPSASSATLNRVTGNTTSTIAGSIQANGQVFLVNPNGIAITPTGNVRTGGFVASTLDISDADFNAGKLRFTGSGASASVVNQGTISTDPGGFVALLGGTVANEGVISVPLGRVGLGSGEQATLDLNGDGFLQVAVPTNATAADGRALVDNRGKVSAAGGLIELKAATAKQALREAVNVSGTLSARSVSGRNGSITLSGGEGGVVRVSGHLSTAAKSPRGGTPTTTTPANGGRIAASGAKVVVDGGGRLDASSATGQGGAVTLTGETIALGTARIDVSGTTGGGTVRIGGDWHGDGTLAHATTVDIAAGTTIKADATTRGNGGSVVVWSDAATSFAGTISAKGGAAGGDGGAAEVSSKGVLAYTGFTDLSAAHGAFGMLLLDPYNVTISDDADASSSGFTASANDSVINATTLATALASANVTVSTGTGGTQAGNITIEAPVTWSAGTTLTLDAAGSIEINAPITVAGAGGLAFVPNHGGSGGTLTFAAAPTFAAGPGGTGIAGQSLRINGTTYKLVYTMDQLDAIDAVNAVDGSGVATYGAGLAGNYALARDLDASGVTYTRALIGTSSGTALTGRLDGLGHTIANLTINAPGVNNVGLIGYLSGATARVSNIGLVGGSVAGHNDIGALVGTNNSGTVEASYATGSVSGYDSVGGLVGYNNSGTVQTSYAVGAVWGNYNAGGLVGINDSGTVQTSYATGAVSGNVEIGGLVGNNYYGTYYGTVQTSYATGAVSGTDSVGGLVGDNTGTVSRSYATGKVTGSTSLGGLVGYNSSSGSISNSYWDRYSTGQSASVGLNYSSHPATMAVTSDPAQSGAANYAYKQSAYGNLNFTTNWFMIDGQTRPFLRAEYSTTIANAHQLQLMAMDLSASYTLAANIDASATARAKTAATPGDRADMWGAFGFVPIGNYSTPFTGRLDGQGHTVTGLTIDRPATDYVGLIGYLSGANTRVSNLGLAGGSVTGHDKVGALVGFNYYGTIETSYATGAVSGNFEIGGLVGANDSGRVETSYATGPVSGSQACIGGLVGANVDGTVETSYATGPVSGNTYVGGLVGYNDSGTVQTSYATGPVSGNSFTGGLVGTQLDGTVSNAYWDTDATGQTDGYGLNTGTFSATGLPTAQMQDLASFATIYAGFDFQNVWAPPNRAGQGGNAAAHYPELYALTPVVWATAANVSRTYGDANPAFTATSHGGPGAYVFGPAGDSLNLGSVFSTTATASSPVATYAIDPATSSVVSSKGTTYRVVSAGATLTVTKRPVTVSGAGASNKVYDGTTTASVSGTLANVVSGDDVALASSAAFASAAAGTGIAVSGYTLGGAEAGNYSLVQPTGVTADITQRPITVTADAKSRAYGDANPALTYTVGGSGLVTGDTLTGALATTATTASPAGMYAITQGSLAASTNYALSYVGADLTVLAAPASPFAPPLLGAVVISGLEALGLPPSGRLWSPVAGMPPREIASPLPSWFDPTNIGALVSGGNQPTGGD